MLRFLVFRTCAPVPRVYASGQGYPIKFRHLRPENVFVIYDLTGDQAYFVDFLGNVLGVKISDISYN